MKMPKIIIALLLLLGSTTQAFAWGQTGHRVTGAIAEQHLSDVARKEVQNILGAEGLAEASTWPDFMRASSDSFWKRKAGPYHYVTVPEGKSYNDVGAPKKGDAITALKMFAKTLKDPTATKKQRALALRFTIHIIGDLHQPLHVGNGTDRGGNSVKVVFFNKNTNLHTVWDSGMIDREGLSYSEMANWLEQKITPVQAKAWSDPDPFVWVAESAAIRDTIYPDDQFLSWGYSFEHIDTVHQRLSQAGVRVAAYLNALYKK
jgi:nuclease S1